MNPLTLNDLSGNAFRILGLTAGASQAQVDAAARKLRIWQNPAMIPGTGNDAPWIGPVARSRQDIENAVARLADPVSRVQQRLWWFCLTPPASDAPVDASGSGAAAFHDSALVHLYRGLLTNTADEDLDAWRTVVERFQILAGSDDYLQWLMEVESAGDFEKRASLQEIAEAQQQLPSRLGTAVAGSVDYALASRNFAAAAQAVQLVSATGSRPAAPNPADELIDRMEDDLAGRCNELIERINTAWETKRLAVLRPACNHAISRFGTVIQPLIEQVATATKDVDRQDRIRMHGVKLLLHTADAYEAIENFMAAQRTLETALELAANTPMEPMVVSRLDKARPAAQRQRAGAPRGRRQQAPDAPEIKMVPGGPMRRESWLSAIPARALWWLVVMALSLARIGCNLHNSTTTPSPIPHDDTSHPPSFGQ